MAAITLAGEQEVPETLSSLRCACGSIGVEEDASRPRETVRLGDKRILALVVRCQKCARNRDLYLDLAHRDLPASRPEG
jgi:hypothetical protein